MAAGMARTARTITAAALIMAAVFGCFLIADILPGGSAMFSVMAPHVTTARGCRIKPFLDLRVAV